MSNNNADHLSTLQDILSICIKHFISLSISQEKLCQNNIEFLEHKIAANQISPPIRKCNAISINKVPTTQNFDLIAPLNALTKKQKKSLHIRKKIPNVNNN